MLGLIVIIVYIGVIIGAAQEGAMSKMSKILLGVGLYLVSMVVWRVVIVVLASVLPTLDLGEVGFLGFTTGLALAVPFYFGYAWLYRKLGGERVYGDEGK